MNGPKTLDQQRAAHAWTVVEQMKGKSKEPTREKKEFGTQAKKLPTRIMAAGLGQALAFLHAKEYAKDLQAALSDWLKIRRPLKTAEDERLLVRVIQGDADFQRYATAECLAYLVWLVRFADAAGLTEGQEA
jgi:CRISPR-associated protein Cmr5